MKKVTVSPKHHQRWLKARAVLLQKTFTPTKAKALKKLLDRKSKKDFKPLPKAKWTANIRFLVSQHDEARVFRLTPFDDLKIAYLIVNNPEDSKTCSVYFLSPVGDPFIACEISTVLKWKKIKLPKDVEAANRKEYLDKLSPAFKRQQGLD